MSDSLLKSLDNVGRTPLFYAVAYNQHEAASFITQVAPESVLQVDAHGDTPLHAAASGGSARCLELIFRVTRSLGEEIVDPVNKMGMTPAHLAKDSTCMEILYQNGANFSTRDTSERTPLFIAAAMNRFARANIIE